MKKSIVISASMLLLLSSCGTYEGAGAYTGAHIGSIVGSAIGGISGGHRGYHVGTLAGVVGGAIVGAAVGRAADEANQREYEKRMERRMERRHAQEEGYQQDYDDSGFDPSNSGDDRITFDNSSSGYPKSADDIGKSSAVPTPSLTNATLEIRNARLFDANDDGSLVRNEQAKVVFEIYNPASNPVFNVQPFVVEATGNRHIYISENVLVESIGPRQTIRYTANVKADDRLRDGEIVIRIGVLQNNKEVIKQSKTFTIPTRKRR